MAELLDDELTFLRDVEQDVQRIRPYAHSSDVGDQVTARNLLTGLKVKLNNRIIELLEEKDANQQRDTGSNT